MSKLRNLIEAAVASGKTFGEAMEKARLAIGAQLKNIKGNDKRQKFILEEVAAPLAACYAVRTGAEDLIAYVSNRGTIAIKDEKAGRTNEAAAANMMLRKWVKQERKTGPVDPMKKAKSLAKQYLALTAAERRVFRVEAGITA